MKRHTTAWEKSFASNMSYRELLPNIYKELSKLNNDKIDNQLKIDKNVKEILLREIYE